MNRHTHAIPYTTSDFGKLSSNYGNRSVVREGNRSSAIVLLFPLYTAIGRSRLADGNLFARPFRIEYINVENTAKRERLFGL